MSGDRTLTIGRHRVNIDALRAQIEKDIAFLTDRIARMENLNSSNPVVLQTYNAMLTSRQSVLRWLQQSDSTLARSDRGIAQALAYGKRFSRTGKT